VRRLRRLRISHPTTTHASAMSLGRSALAAFLDGMRKLFWEDLRPGVVHTGDLPRLTRNLAWLGFVLVFAGVGMLFLGEPLRRAFPCYPWSGGRRAGEISSLTSSFP
jgi:hypothetical protein